MRSKLDIAMDVAEFHFDSILDDSGKSYYQAHLLQVLNIIRLVTDDEDLHCAAVLHDIIEDTNVTYEMIKIDFGQRVADLVNEVTHEGAKDEYGFYFPRLETKNGILLKFADRLSNLSRMECWTKERQEHYLKKSKFWKDGK